jgi:ArsR family transcriptional regulator
MPTRTATATRERVDADELLRVLAEPLRWQIVELLTDEDLCVCHITEELGVAQTLVSHHLRVLREAEIVVTERHRYWTYYSLVPSSLQPVAASLAAMARPRRRNARRRPCG